MIAHGLSVSNPSLVQIDHSPLVLIKLSSAVCVKSLQLLHYISGQHMLKWIDLTKLFLLLRDYTCSKLANCQVCTECRTDGKSTLKVHPGPLGKNRKWIRRRSKSSSVQLQWKYSWLLHCKLQDNAVTHRIVGPCVASQQVCTECRTDGKSTLKVHPGPLERKPKWVIQRGNKSTRVQCNALIAQHSNDRLLQKLQNCARTKIFVKNVELLLFICIQQKPPTFSTSVSAF